MNTIDITKCKDDNCKLNSSCDRFTLTPELLEPYFLESPREEDGRCKYYKQ